MEYGTQIIMRPVCWHQRIDVTTSPVSAFVRGTTTMQIATSIDHRARQSSVLARFVTAKCYSWARVECCCRSRRFDAFFRLLIDLVSFCQILMDVSLTTPSVADRAIVCGGFAPLLRPSTLRRISPLCFGVMTFLRLMFS